MKPNEILDKILAYSGLNAKSFSEKIKLDRPQGVYDILNEKTKSISQAMANKIISVFPEIDRSWLLTGEGEMLKNKSKDSNNEMDGIEYANLLNRLIREKQLAPFALLEQKEQEIKELNREIGRLEERLETSKKMDVQGGGTAICADAK
jgi:hypothetical protein